MIIDGFSPNLNKRLHAGHLRNLALAGFLKRSHNAKLVAMLGVSLGERPEARDELAVWLRRAGLEYSASMTDADAWTHAGHCVLADQCVQRDGAWFRGDVVVVRSNGRPTYAGHDLAFAYAVSPDYYLTGHEQREHFQSIGLGDKHLPMGLVLDAQGHKLKSRDGSAMLADDLFAAVRNAVKGDDTTKDKLAWNIIALAMLTPSREMPVKLDTKALIERKAAGIWVSYTRARLWSALRETIPAKPLAHGTLCPAPFAQRLLEKCGEAGALCDRKAERIRGGTPEHRMRCLTLLAEIDGLMGLLGMNLLDRV